MLSYLFLGANDVPASARFFEAVLTPLGYTKESSGGQYCFSLPEANDPSNGPGSIHIAKPFDGHPATVGNGVMPAFKAATRNLVDEVHAAGLAAGGEDEGPPGTRNRYSDTFFVAYLRDRAGNKLAVFCDVV